MNHGCRLTQQGVNRLVRSLQTDFFAHPAMQASAQAQPVIDPLPKDRPFVTPRDFLYPLLSSNTEEKKRTASSSGVQTTATAASTAPATTATVTAAATTTATATASATATTQPVA